jgi:hypothetical protein
VLFVQDDLSPPSLEEKYDSLGKEENLLRQKEDGQTNNLQRVHGSITLAFWAW